MEQIGPLPLPQHRLFRPWPAPLLALIVITNVGSSPARADALARVRDSGRLVYGSDAEGGAPYLFPDPRDSLHYVGFEVELMERLASRLKVKAVFQQNQWDRLLQVLDTGRIDVVVNGYELTDDRARDYLATRSYYVYQLQLIARRGGGLHAWDDFQRPRPGGRTWRIGVLTNSAADAYAHDVADFNAWKAGEARVEVRRYDGSTDAMNDVLDGRLDATVQDVPAARYLLKDARFRELRPVGHPVGGGKYVMYLRKGDEALRDALDQGITALIESGELRSIDQKYGIWNEAQEQLNEPTSLAERAGPVAGRGGSWEILSASVPFLIAAARTTVLLSIISMPSAMILGLAVALGRKYGPRPIRWLLIVYVEMIRGTPLMLQLYVLYFLLPEVGIVLPALAAGIVGLALNYSAYEAEIYRAGIQAIPVGQMEAALALGMSRGLALRRVVLPQALRIVIPPVTSDFITLFKDSSVCSVIGLVELSKQYSILTNNNGHVVTFGLTVAAIYMVLSLPLARLSHRLERRLEGEEVAS